MSTVNNAALANKSRMRSIVRRSSVENAQQVMPTGIHCVNLSRTYFPSCLRCCTNERLPNWGLQGLPGQICLVSNGQIRLVLHMTKVDTADTLGFRWGDHQLTIISSSLKNSINFNCMWYETQWGSPLEAKPNPKDLTKWTRTFPFQLQLETNYRCWGRAPSVLGVISSFKCRQRLKLVRR